MQVNGGMPHDAQHAEPSALPRSAATGAAMVVAQGNHGFEGRGTGWAMLLGQVNRG